jgi:hypothetical protein
VPVVYFHAKLLLPPPATGSSGLGPEVPVVHFRANWSRTGSTGSPDIYFLGGITLSSGPQIGCSIYVFLTISMRGMQW